MITALIEFCSEIPMQFVEAVPSKALLEEGETFTLVMKLSKAPKDFKVLKSGQEISEAVDSRYRIVVQNTEVKFEISNVRKDDEATYRFRAGQAAAKIEVNVKEGTRSRHLEDTICFILIIELLISIDRGQSINFLLNVNVMLTFPYITFRSVMLRFFAFRYVTLLCVPFSYVSLRSVILRFFAFRSYVSLRPVMLRQHTGITISVSLLLKC